MDSIERKKYIDMLVDQLDSEIMEKDLEFIMRQYQENRSPLLAKRVLNQIEALCNHPFFHGSDEQRCCYRRLAQQWRHFASEQPAIAGA